MANGIPQRLVRVITSMKNKDEFGGNLRWKYSPEPKCYKCGTLGNYEKKFPNPTNTREQTSFYRVKKVHMSPKEMIKNYKCALCRKKGHREPSAQKAEPLEIHTMQKNILHQRSKLQLFFIIRKHKF